MDRLLWTGTPRGLRRTGTGRGSHHSRADSTTRGDRGAISPGLPAGPASRRCPRRRGAAPWRICEPSRSSRTRLHGSGELLGRRPQPGHGAPRKGPEPPDYRVKRPVRRRYHRHRPDPQLPAAQQSARASQRAGMRTFDRPDHRLIDIPIRYKGFDLPTASSWAMDWTTLGRYRNLPFIERSNPRCSTSNVEQG